MLGWFKKELPTVEVWANQNAKKATPDGLIAGAIIQSFAKDFKGWKFEGAFNQRHDANGDGGFQRTTLSRKMVAKKHIEIVFVFKKTGGSDGYSTIYKYKCIGCEVNGIRVTDFAFKRILVAWNGIVVEVKHAESVAAQAKAEMEANESKWDLAENLLGMKRDGLGGLQPVKIIEEAGQ